MSFPLLNDKQPFNFQPFNFWGSVTLISREKIWGGPKITISTLPETNSKSLWKKGLNAPKEKFHQPKPWNFQNL